MDFMSLIVGYFLGWVANTLVQRFRGGRHKYGRAFPRKSNFKELQPPHSKIQNIVGGNSVIVGGNMIINNHSPPARPILALEKKPGETYEY